MNNEQPGAVVQTRRWVEDVVIGHNFCPFAKPSLDQTHYELLKGGAEQRMQQLLDCCFRLRENSEIETTLLVVEEGLGDFDDYLDELSLAEELMASMGLEGEFQLASFHPDYCFAETVPQAAENYTNRSPYPMFHLLRESSLSRALAEVGSPEKIPRRNQKYAQELGAEALAKMLRGCRKPRESADV